MIDPSKITRWRGTASTWTKKTVALLLNAEPRNSEEEWLVGYDAHRFMDDVLSEIQMLVPLLREEQTEEVERRVKALALAVRSHRLAAKLENVEGRTPEEARAFLDKAANLRQDAGI